MVCSPNDQRVVQDEFLRQCEAAPAGSFGSEYYNFMSKRNFSADERPPVRFVDDAELAYVATRYRQVHDFWHVIFACNTSLLGETTLKALEFSQVRFTTCSRRGLLPSKLMSQVVDVYCQGNTISCASKHTYHVFASDSVHAEPCFRPASD